MEFKILNISCEEEKQVCEEYIKAYPNLRFWNTEMLKTQNSCTCGAQHTSNPTFHSSWCGAK